MFMWSGAIRGALDSPALILILIFFHHILQHTSISCKHHTNNNPSILKSFNPNKQVRPALPDYDAIRGLDCQFLRNAPKLIGIADTERMTYFDLEQRRLLREQNFDPAENTRMKKMQVCLVYV